MQQPEQQSELLDIYPVEYDPWFLQSWFILSVIGVVLFVLGYSIYRWYSQRKKTDVPYTEQILMQLDVLQKSDWSHHKQFYIQLTSLLKHYLQYRFKKQFVGTTDIECLEILRIDKFIPEWIPSRFEDLIEGVMFVKFANAQAAQERMQKDLENVRTIVENTQIK